MEDELTDQFSVEDVFVDGFTKHVLSPSGYMSCIGYRDIDGHKIAVCRLIWPSVNTMAAVEEAEAALAMPRTPPPKSGSKRGVH